MALNCKFVLENQLLHIWLRGISVAVHGLSPGAAGRSRSVVACRLVTAGAPRGSGCAGGGGSSGLWVCGLQGLLGALGVRASVAVAQAPSLWRSCFEARGIFPDQG